MAATGGLLTLRATVSNGGAAAADRCGAAGAASGRRAPACCSSASLPLVSRVVRPLRRVHLGRRRGENRTTLVCMSVDVDDNDLNTSAPTDGSPSPKEEELVKEAREELQEALDPRRGLEEKFLVVNVGKYECRSCGYQYEAEKGDDFYGIAAGTPFAELPKDWRCPTCGAAQSYFQNKGMEVAGFVQNQGYGLGGNSLTEGQKSLLIYGSLVVFFLIFLSGYLLQ